VAGFTGAIYYLWPMLHVVMTAARAVAVHSAPLADDLREEFPETTVLHVRMGVRGPREGRLTDRDQRSPAGAGGACGLQPSADDAGEAPPSGVAGLDAIGPYAPHAELVLVGDTVGHYDVASDIADLSLGTASASRGACPTRSSITSWPRPTWPSASAGERRRDVGVVVAVPRGRVAHHHHRPRHHD